MSHLRRLAIGMVAMLAIMVLGIVIDGVVDPLVQMNYDQGVDSGPFASVLERANEVRWLLVPGMLLGIILWLVYGTVREERAEELRRRVGP